MNVSSGYRKHGFDAYGGKYLKKEDMAYWLNKKEMTDPRGVALGLDKEVEEVEEDFFDLLPTIDELWIHNPRCRLVMNEKTIKLFRKKQGAAPRRVRFGGGKARAGARAALPAS